LLRWWPFRRRLMHGRAVFHGGLMLQRRAVFDGRWVLWRRPGRAFHSRLMLVSRRRALRRRTVWATRRRALGWRTWRRSTGWRALRRMSAVAAVLGGLVVEVVRWAVACHGSDRIGRAAESARNWIPQKVFTLSMLANIPGHLYPQAALAVRRT
jgi:hypothetical protein